MSTIKKTDDESHPIIEEIYKDIKQTRNTSYIGNFWKYLAFDPNLLKNVWTDIKNIMVKESIIPNKTKEMIYMLFLLLTIVVTVRTHTQLQQKN